jgi:hypothetical protein
VTRVTHDDGCVLHDGHRTGFVTPRAFPSVYKAHHLLPQFARLAVFTSVARLGSRVYRALKNTGHKKRKYSGTSSLRRSIKPTASPLVRQPRRSFRISLSPPPPPREVEMASLEQKVKKHIHLFYCSECEELAQKIAASSDSIELQSINWR